MDMHLVWTTGRIFIKPVPRFLLEPHFWEAYLCCDQGCDPTGPLITNALSLSTFRNEGYTRQEQCSAALRYHRAARRFLEEMAARPKCIPQILTFHGRYGYPTLQSLSPSVVYVNTLIAFRSRVVFEELHLRLALGINSQYLRRGH